VLGEVVRWPTFADTMSLPLDLGETILTQTSIFFMPLIELMFPGGVNIGLYKLRVVPTPCWTAGFDEDNDDLGFKSF